MISVAEHDLDGFVRRVTADCLNIIREWVKEWVEKPLKIDVKLRQAEEEGQKEHVSMLLKEKEDNAKNLETKRRPVLEY